MNKYIAPARDTLVLQEIPGAKLIQQSTPHFLHISLYMHIPIHK